MVRHRIPRRPPGTAGARQGSPVGYAVLCIPPATVLTARHFPRQSRDSISAAPTCRAIAEAPRLCLRKVPGPIQPPRLSHRRCRAGQIRAKPSPERRPGPNASSRFMACGKRAKPVRARRRLDDRKDVPCTKDQGRAIPLHCCITSPWPQGHGFHSSQVVGKGPGSDDGCRRASPAARSPVRPQSRASQLLITVARVVEFSWRAVVGRCEPPLSALPTRQKWL